MDDNRKEISEQELLQLEMVGGGTIQDLIDKHPEIEGWRSAIISGTYRCLKVHWPMVRLETVLQAFPLFNIMET